MNTFNDNDNETPEYGYADYDYAPADTIAWRGFNNRTGTPAAWSQTHRTNDNGRTTLCGLTVPAEAFEFCASGGFNRCKRCAKAKA